MFGRNWSSGYGEKDFLNIFNIILLFRNYLPLEKGVALNWKKKLNPALCQDWMELAQWFWKRFLNIFNLFFAILLLFFSLGEERGL